MLKQGNAAVCGRREALKRKLLCPSVCIPSAFQLVRKWKSYRSGCALHRARVGAGYLVKSSCVVVAIGKYDLLVTMVVKSCIF